MRDVKPLAARILTHLFNYRDATQDPPAIRNLLQHITLREGEEVLGVYENTLGQTEDSILVTTFGLYIRHDLGWTSLDFEDIRATHGPETKEEISGITVGLADGRNIFLPVRGAQGQYRDAFGFLRFLDRVIEKYPLR